MRAPFISLVLALGLACACALPAVAQPQQPQGRSGDAEQPERTFAVTLIASGTRRLHYADTEGEHTILPPGRARTSERHPYRGSSPIRFYEWREGPDGEQVKHVLAEASFDASLDDMLVLLHPGDAQWQRVRSFVLDDSAEAFPPNSVRVFNISLYPLACAINDERFQLGRQEQQRVRVDDGAAMLRWKIAARIRSEWKLVRSSVSQFLPGMRQLIVVNVQSDEDGALQLDIFPLYDRPEPTDSQRE